MQTYEIKDIDFRHPVTPGIGDLQYPLYPTLIDYSVVKDTFRESLQIEPAFQFLAPIDEIYEFVLKMKNPSDWRFAKDQLGPGPAFKETTKRSLASAPKVTLSFESGRQICRVRVNLKDWNGPELIVLRIFCNHRDKKEDDYDDLDGVSLTLVKPGGKVMTGLGTEDPESPSFDLKVTGTREILKGLFVPEYEIFQGAENLEGLSIEPVFRISPNRPAANVQVVLGTGLSFPKSLKVYTRDNLGFRPPELSKLASTTTTLPFSWNGGPMPAPKKFGFHVPVAMLSPSLARPSSAVAQPSEPMTWVDPILFHDPPMG
jgi:hypothetical protein